MDKLTRKKILFVITKSNWGGAQRYVFDLSSNLKDEYDLAVACGGKGELITKLEELGIKTVMVENLRRNVSIIDDVKVFFKLLKIITDINPDIIHLNSSKVGGLGALAARLVNSYLFRLYYIKLKRQPLHKILIVFTVHGWFFNEQRSQFIKFASKLLQALSVLVTHKTIVVSQTLKEQVRSWPSLILDKITVIQNGIGKHALMKKMAARELLISNHPALSDHIPKPKKTDKTVWVGTIAELHKNKGLAHLIDGIKHLERKHEKVILVIVGDGEEKEFLRKRVDNNDLSGKIFMIGQLENAAQYLCAFDIFALTSITEGLPYVILEAGAAGVPVVASSVGGIPEIMDQLETGILIRPKEPKEVKEAVSFLIENKNKKKEMAVKLKQKIKSNFSLERMVEETRKVYER